MLATDVSLALVAAIAAITDWRWRRIPNWLTAPAFIAGCVVNAQAGGLPGAGHALAGAGLALLIHVPLWLLRASGGGDVKLMAALGAILGPQQWLVLFLISAVLGGLAAVAVVLWHGALRRTLGNVTRILADVVRLRMPHHRGIGLDLADEKSLTVPRGVVVGVSVAVLLAARLRAS